MAEGKSWWDTYGNDATAAALAIYNQQQSKKDPKFTNVPLTPEEQWRFDRGKELFDYSPTRDFVGQYGTGFLKSLNSLPNAAKGVQFASPQMKGQQLAGGFEFPQWDFDKMPQPWREGYIVPNRDPKSIKDPAIKTPTTDPTTDPTVDDVGAITAENPGGGKRLPTVMRDSGGGFNSPTIKPYNDPTYTGLQPPPGQTGGGGTRAGGGNIWQRIGSAWQQFTTDHPNWAGMSKSAIYAAIIAYTGPLGAIGVKILDSLISGQTPPPSGQPAQSTPNPANPTTPYVP